MRAGKAYIASAGTTGVLIASAILLLVVVGALMAFDSEAEPDALLPVPSVLVSPMERAEAAAAGSATGSDDAERSDRTRADSPDAPAGAPIADRQRSGPGDGPDAPSIPAVPDLDNPPGEGSGDAQGPTATAGPAPTQTSEPQAAEPVAPVGGVVDDAVRDVTSMLPRPLPVLP